MSLLLLYYRSVVVKSTRRRSCRYDWRMASICPSERGDDGGEGREEGQAASPRSWSRASR